MKAKTVLLAGTLGATAVILGAFGAHLLKDILPTAKLTSFETAVRYQMYHALLLLFISSSKETYSKLSSRLIIIGVALFCGSIYLLSLKDFFGIGWFKYFGPITPIGGVFLISGWLSLIINVLKSPKNS